MKPVVSITIDPTTTLHLHYEDTSPSKHFDDPEIAQEVARDAKTNIWSWFTAEVAVSIPGTDVKASAFLGCCSYANFEEFASDGLVHVRADAIDKLKEKAKERLEQVDKIREYLCV